jgi:energy-coupling factor transport system ATP-binding protein
MPQTLSGGEQQKLALAAIVARKPEVLVLDEPLSMLDVTAATEFMRYLITLMAHGTTVIMLEHRAEYLAQVPGLRRITLNGKTHTTAHADSISSERPVFEQIAAPFELQVNDLMVRLGKQFVLDKLSFSAQSGETIAIVGRNGTGKTTLLRALAGLQPHEGAITINGDAHAPDFGMVYQNADLQLFTASVRDEILYGVVQPDMQLYAALLARLGLEDYETMPPLLLSEGEKKRVALATVLIRQPRHGVLLDEPSLGQDARHKAMLMRIARSLNDAGRLVIMTTHDLVLAAQADRIILLNEEGFVTNGPPDQVFQDDRAWAACGLFVPDWIAASFGRETQQVTAHETR